MSPFFLRSSTPFLAIDVSSESLQLLEVRVTKNRYQLQNYSTHPLPANCVIQQRISDITAFSQILANAVNQFKPRAKQAILALPVNQVITKTLPILSHLSPSEVTKHIQYEVLAQMPTSTEIYWDYAYISAMPRGTKATTQEISIVIAQQTSITPYLQAFNHCHLPLCTIDVESYALARAWCWAYSHQTSEPNLHALLLLRAQLITLVLMQGKRVLYARGCPVEAQVPYDVALLPCIQQLWSTLPLNPDWPAITQIGLVGECAQQTYAALLSVELAVPVFLLELGNEFLAGQKFSFIEPSKLFLSLGLCLWGKDDF
ncbi:MAG: type IV pilus biogenesis protein PilM [Gammaproteobacteria bacterium]